ncbi:MAG: winged helix-turn-helix domain-containing protein [Nakamurella sp.]
MADISDPGAIRALAHPLRMRLLQALAVRITATATELADDVNESPSNCSFHLRKLAEFGYIDRADAATGRDKPWRISDPTQNLLPDPQDHRAVEASRATGAAIFEWDVATLRAGHARRDAPEWRGTTLQNGATMIVTPDEARAINAALEAVLEPYFARLTDHSLVPAGAGVIRLMIASTYLPEHQELIDSETAGSAVAPQVLGDEESQR